jgi:TnpA family transposase
MVHATSIMKTLRIDDRATNLAQAVAELGRIDKTIHALTFIDDEKQTPAAAAPGRITGPELRYV